MYISSRLLKVIDFLQKNNVTTIKDIAEGCNITERMVRYDIENLNFLLKLNNIVPIEKLPKGRIIASEEFISSKIVKGFKDLNKYSKEERIEYIKARLLIDGKINLSHLARELDVSRTSIRGDLAMVVNEIEDEDIKVIKNELISDERSIRTSILKNFSKPLLKLQSKSITEEESLLDNYLRDLIIEVSQSKLRGVIESIAKDMENKNINYFSSIWLHIIVSFMRLKNGKVRECIDEDKIIKEKNAYRVLEKYIDSLQEILGIEYTETEIIGLAKCIEGCMSNGINSYVYENWIDIVLIIKDTINDVSKFSGINLTNDEILINGLLNHIKPAIYRIVKNISLEIDICMDIVEPYTDLLNLIEKNFKRLEKIINIEISRDEIALIAIHFLASIERNKDKYGEFKNILLVCGGGFGTTSIVANRIIANYNVNIIDMVAYSDFLEYDLSNIDYIVSLLKIDGDSFKDKPIIKISPFITEKDKSILAKYLPKVDSNRYRLNEILEIVNDSTEINNKEQVANYLEKAIVEKNKGVQANKTLRDYIDIDKAAIIDKVYSWQESIARTGELLEKSGDIEKKYTDSIIKTSENFGVHFILNNGVVIPHGEVDYHVNKSSISILYVKEPVQFNYGKIGHLFFMIAAKTTKDHVKSIEEIDKLSNNVEAINELKNVNSKEELVEVILRHID